MRRRQLKRLWKRPTEVQSMCLDREELLMKLGGIHMVDVQIPTSDGRMVLLQRTTRPEADVKLVLGRLCRVRHRQAGHSLRKNRRL